MDNQTLQRMLELHAQWARGESGGKRADLSGADLSDADLRGATRIDSVKKTSA